MYGKVNYIGKVRTFLRYLVFAEGISLISLLIKAAVTSNFAPILSVLRTNLTLKTLFFGSVFNGTLWYLYAMIWTYVILFILSKFRYGFTIGYASIAFLLLFHMNKVPGDLFQIQPTDIGQSR